MITYTIRDRDHPDYNPDSITSVSEFPTREVTRRGVLYSMAGAEIELFRISVLAEALDRKNQVIIDWEKTGRFPRPFFVVSSSKSHRWYSGVQILNMHRIVWYKWGCRKNSTLDLSKMLEDLRTVFYANKIVVDKHGEVIE